MATYRLENGQRITGYYNGGKFYRMYEPTRGFIYYGIELDGEFPIMSLEEKCQSEEHQLENHKPRNHQSENNNYKDFKVIYGDKGTYFVSKNCILNNNKERRKKWLDECEEK
ncbi:unnamed protein product [marine sediment metagenome]|uniref:Uncharacterized protein n=1 Tax=marine sediment metagenome TaxID=412755 RepID=X0ZJ57_9ZZZZ